MSEFGSAWSQLEYGVMVDRRSAGLGIRLANVATSRERAEEFAARERSHHNHPVGVQVRLVQYGDWHAPVGGEHVPGCNERCRPEAHYLTAADAPETSVSATEERG